MVRMDSSGDREPDYSLKYYVNGSFQGIADYNYSTGGFNLRGELFFCGYLSLQSAEAPLCCREAGEGNNESRRGTMGRKIYNCYFYRNPQRGPLRRRECEYFLPRNCSNGKTRLASHQV